MHVLWVLYKAPELQVRSIVFVATLHETSARYSALMVGTSMIPAVVSNLVSILSDRERKTIGTHKHSYGFTFKNYFCLGHIFFFFSSGIGTPKMVIRIQVVSSVYPDHI